MTPPRLLRLSPLGSAAGCLALLAGWALSPARADVFSQVPEAATQGYQLLYTLPVSTEADYSTTTPAYTVDNSARITGSISRVAYYMELKTATGELQYAYASMDAFTQDLTLLGIPTAVSGAYFNQSVYNMTVFSNVTGVTVGAVQTGNLEFFHSAYTAASATNPPNSSGGIYDWGDSPDGPHGTGNYGSFQIANPLKSEEIICYNNWGGAGGIGDIGLGNGIGDSLDFSFTNNAAAYTVKNIQVLVQLGAPPARIQVMPLGDSITNGYQSTKGGGYRTPLLDDLDSTGRIYDFVGSTGDNSSTMPKAPTILTTLSEQQHEGHNTYRIDQLSGNIAGNLGNAGNDGGYWLADNPGVQPTYILVHVGTNDINGAYDPTTTNPTDSEFTADLIGRLETLLDAIIAQRPATHILLAGIIPVNSNALTLTRTALFNQAIQTTVITDAKYAGKLTYVDQYSRFLNADGTVNTTLYTDSLHPDDAGYTLMATNWFNAINTLDTSLPRVSGLNATSIDSTSTTISGTINPSGREATFYVQYGLTTKYGQNSAVQQIASDQYAARTFSATLGGLKAGATYHYQVIATSSTGTSTTQDTVFIAGNNAPLITSPSSVSATVGVAFAFRITANDTPTSFTASRLPEGLTIASGTGLISGVAKHVGTFSVGVTAATSQGTATARLVLSVLPVSPEATVMAKVPTVREGSGKVGEFLLTISAAHPSGLTLNYRITGNAVNGVDYKLLTGKAYIKPGATSVLVRIVPLGDLDGDAKKTVGLTIISGKDYTVGVRKKATVTIDGQ